MDILKELLIVLCRQDFKSLSDPSLIFTLYFVVCIILFLENGLLPAAFLPGDSLLILLGVLIAKNTLNCPITLMLLTVSGSLGSWISYLQGKWLKNNKFVKSWLENLPIRYHQRAHRMFHRHGLLALLVGRFIAFVRTLLPIIAGLSGLNSYRFHFFNWISSFLWVGIFILVGFILGKSTVFQRYEEELMLCLMLLPLFLLGIGLISSIIFIFRRNK